MPTGCGPFEGVPGDRRDFLVHLDTATGCLLWLEDFWPDGQPRDGGGLGARTVWRAHGYALPPRATLRRTCRDVACVNPQHHLLDTTTSVCQGPVCVTCDGYAGWTPRQLLDLPEGEGPTCFACWRAEHGRYWADDEGQEFLRLVEAALTDEDRKAHPARSLIPDA